MALNMESLERIMLEYYMPVFRNTLENPLFGQGEIDMPRSTATQLQNELDNEIRRQNDMAGAMPPSYRDDAMDAQRYALNSYRKRVEERMRQAYLYGNFEPRGVEETVPTFVVSETKRPVTIT